MNLIIDAGNTLTKLGVFDGERLLEVMIWQKGWTLKQLQQLMKDFSVRQIALSVTGQLPRRAESFLSQQPVFLKLNASTSLPIKNLYKSPETLGNDRLAAVVGAWQLYPENTCLVIDAGTCITYDIIDNEGSYHGGNICPGLEMRLKAMHHFTAKLPLVEVRTDHFELTGDTTESAIRNGAQTGAVMEMESFIRSFRRQFGRINLILTGGDADYFANHLKTKIFVYPNLVLTGLNKILNYNVQNPT